MVLMILNKKNGYNNDFIDLVNMYLGEIIKNNMFLDIYCLIFVLVFWIKFVG